MDNLIKALEKQGIKKYTKVQDLSINKILENKDLLVSSGTGTGKTLAYLLPIFQKITEEKTPQALILAPTHELVMQITEQAKLLATNSNKNINSFSLIGEVNIKKQINNFKNIKPQIIVGTCGRVLDLITQKKLKAHNIKTIVLDEVDILTDDKNLDTIKKIIKSTLKERQVLGFSASLDDKTINKCNEFMKNVEIIRVKENITINKNISHSYIHCERREKFTILRKLIASTKPKRCIVFVNDENSIEIITAKLNYHNYKTCCISGKMKKEDRKNALNSFRLGKNNILVSSDLSSRGLDITEVSHIFNLDFPLNKNEYLHRCGRTSRKGDKGYAISIVTNQNLSTIRNYKKNFNIDIKKKEMKEGKLIDKK